MGLTVCGMNHRIRTHSGPPIQHRQHPSSHAPLLSRGLCMGWCCDDSPRSMGAWCSDRCLPHIPVLSKGLCVGWCCDDCPPTVRLRGVLGAGASSLRWVWLTLSPRRLPVLTALACRSGAVRMRGVLGAGAGRGEVLPGRDPPLRRRPFVGGGPGPFFPCLLPSSLSLASGAVLSQRKACFRSRPALLSAVSPLACSSWCCSCFSSQSKACFPEELLARTFSVLVFLRCCGVSPVLVCFSPLARSTWCPSWLDPLPLPLRFSRSFFPRCKQLFCSL